MQRFKNILVVYDLVPGCDETLQRAVELARRNDGHLTILSALNPVTNETEILAERERLLARITSSIDLPADKKNHLVQHGAPAQKILQEAKTIKADLIVTSDISSGYYTQMLGLDTTTELLREANCPVWVVRSKDQPAYRRIVAAVNAGKENALDCPANRRILEIGSSLAELEKANLHVVYAWDFVDAERDMMSSELPRGKFSEHYEKTELKKLDLIENLVKHVLGDTPAINSVPIRGKPGDAVVDYIEKQDADLLIADGNIGSPIISALVQGTSLQLLRQSSCSILFARPEPDVSSTHLTDAA